MATVVNSTPLCPSVSLKRPGNSLSLSLSLSLSSSLFQINADSIWVSIMLSSIYWEFGCWEVPSGEASVPYL